MNLKCFFICTFSSVWVEFRLWATTFCRVKGYLSVSVPTSSLNANIQSLAVYNDASFSIFEWGHCWWWCFTCESTFQNLLARVVCHQSTMRTVYHYCKASHLLFRCGSLLHGDRAIGLPLSQRMTPRGTHFPDKWGAVISIGLFGQKCPTRSSFRATGLENTCKDTYKCASAWAGTHTHPSKDVHVQMQTFKHFQTFSHIITHSIHTV